ncbi:MAG: mechanosensitive ion channel, partial [Jaaginema sp. PMC 1080.18]|nr:mechanosensitive ion channel [Jaaginema sp. PMC 1080.18]
MNQLPFYLPQGDRFPVKLKMNNRCLKYRLSQWFLQLLAIIFIVSSGLNLIPSLSLATPTPNTPGNPSPAPETVTTAPIMVDGRRIFNVNKSGAFSAQERAENANKVLSQAIQATASPISVEISKQEGLPIIKVNGNHLLSVTVEDIPEGKTPQEQANQWAVDIETAIARAQKERSSEYLIQAGIKACGWVILATALSWGLGVLWETWLQPLIRNFSAEPETAPQESSRSTIIGSQILLNLLRVMIWLIALIYISDLFVQTRLLGQDFRSLIIRSLTAELVPLGGESYSALDVLRLIGLFVLLMIISKTFKQILRSRFLNLTGLSRASQETIASISNYIFIFIGTIVVLQLWGLELSSLTVFAGVLGVGLGLGLQGIAKEFISGLAIIFERPIQVGDFVEVGDLMGTVERIGVRSTTIATLDQISVILPNSRFLESEVINWTHQTPISRLKVPLGVAYGSHLETVRNVLLEAAQNHADVLSQPMPSVFFQGFGDSSLDFVLLVWISNPTRQFRIKSDLYFAIEQGFRDRGVEIPFPQRDLHLRSGTEVFQSSVFGERGEG